MVSRHALLELWIVAMPACALLAAPAIAVAGDRKPTDWRSAATDGDRTRLRGWRVAWMTALEQARAGGADAAVVAEGALFQPDRVMDNAAPAAGEYRCRMFKLGRQDSATPTFAALAWQRCRISDEDGGLHLSQLDGPQRLSGAVLDGGARRVFLGTMAFGDERRELAYGRDASRDVAGVVEHVGADRWRLVLPYPRFESMLDVMELRPAS